MAKLPKKVTTEIKEVDVRQFVSSAAQKPGSASSVSRVNITITNEDLSISQTYQDEYGVSRADVIRAGMVMLGQLQDKERRALFNEIRKNSPKAGRPSVNK